MLKINGKSFTPDEEDKLYKRLSRRRGFREEDCEVSEAGRQPGPAIRVRHIPTGLVVESHSHRSPYANRNSAFETMHEAVENNDDC